MNIFFLQKKKKNFQFIEFLLHLYIKKNLNFIYYKKKIILLLTELKKLKETYFVIYDLNINQIKII